MKHKHKYINVFLALLLLATTSLTKTYEFVKTIEVAGRQGVAVDSNYYYVSGSNVLYKYSKKGELLKTNETPFKKLSLNANHLGDIDYYNGELFAGAEYFNDGSASNIQIVIYDAETLEFKKFFKWESESGQREVCAITVDSKNGIVWMADWIYGAYLYKYDLTSGKYLGKLHIYPVPEKQQGVKILEEKIFITADDGDAEYNEADHLYSVPLYPNKTAGKTMLVKTFKNVKLQGEIEGLTFNEARNELVVHFNRGTRVVKGMPIGFYPNYTKEIHELYIYKIIN